jgi:pimeloyl-ACP methyl ester carboxylesterase
MEKRDQHSMERNADVRDRATRFVELLTSHQRDLYVYINTMLLGHSAGGLISRRFVEDVPDSVLEPLSARASAFAAQRARVGDGDFDSLLGEPPRDGGADEAAADDQYGLLHPYMVNGKPV